MYAKLWRLLSITVNTTSSWKAPTKLTLVSKSFPTQFCYCYMNLIAHNYTCQVSIWTSASPQNSIFAPFQLIVKNRFNFLPLTNRSEILQQYRGNVYERRFHCVYDMTSNYIGGVSQFSLFETVRFIWTDHSPQHQAFHSRKLCHKIPMWIL